MRHVLTLLTQKWPEYLLEILVITIGILGAFLLNSWNEGRKDRAEERNILLGLKKECEANISEITRNVELNSAAINATVALIDYIRTNESPTKDHMFDSLLIQSTWFGTFDAQTGVVEETISSGKLSLIRDPLLRERLTGISGILNNAQEDYVIRINYYSSIMIPYYSKHFPLANGDQFLDYSSWSDAYRTKLLTPSPFQELGKPVNLLELENVLWYNKVNNDFVNLNEQEMKRFFSETLDLINKNLNTR